jgi:transcriptional regulator with XRE-family HTH domain
MTQTTMGCRIEQARREQGFNNRQLATRLGVKPATIENWESDRSEPRSNKLLTLAGILNVSVLWLLQGEHGSGTARQNQVFSETASIAQKLDRAVALQQEIAALLIETSADITRLQRELDSEKDMAA